MSSAISPGKPWVARIAEPMGRPWVWLSFLGLLVAFQLVRALLSPTPPSLPILYPVPDFAFVDQSGGSFSSRSLKGKVWVANFVFTRCPTLCPLLTARMAAVQKRTLNLGDSVHLVSFTVDPEYDRPQVLQAFARRHQANPRIWTFLTGERSDLQRTLVEGLKVPMTREGPADDLMGIGHGGHFVLIDREMRVRGYYQAEDDTAIDRLVRDVGVLVNEE